MTRLCISGIKVDAKQQAACAAEQICIELVALYRWLSRAPNVVYGKGYTICKFANYGPADAATDGLSSFASKQSWTKCHLLQLQVTEQALQSASSSNNLQQQLPTMTAVQICADNKICSSISFRRHFLKYADERDAYLCASLAEVNIAGSASLYSSAGIA